jgi:hypothetical protein
MDVDLLKERKILSTKWARLLLKRKTRQLCLVEKNGGDKKGRKQVGAHLVDEAVKFCSQKGFVGVIELLFTGAP